MSVRRLMTWVKQHIESVKPYESAVRAHEPERGEAGAVHRRSVRQRHREIREQVLQLAESDPALATAHRTVSANSGRRQRLAESVGIDLAVPGLPFVPHKAESKSAARFSAPLSGAHGEDDA